jgi:hypothetical protein
MGSDTREYDDTRPKWPTIVLCAGFFGLSAAVLGAKAANNDRGLIINHVIELGPEGATTFYWALTALSVGFVAISAFMACHRLGYRRRLAVGPASPSTAAEWYACYRSPQYFQGDLASAATAALQEALAAKGEPSEGEGAVFVSVLLATDPREERFGVWPP